MKNPGDGFSRRTESLFGRSWFRKMVSGSLMMRRKKLNCTKPTVSFLLQP
jgi:hypothetical protein